MYLSKFGVFLVVALGIPCVMAMPSRVFAQYRCAVAIELKGKAILKGEIRDVERPPTNQLWELLQSLSFSATENGKDVPDPKTVDRVTLKGELRVKVNGAGQVQLEELRLVRNKLNASAWVIAPEDVTRILKMRKTPGSEQPKK